MIICKIWDADYPWDVRVEKVCRSLQKKHELHLVCRNLQRRPRFECLEGLKIHRLPHLPGIFERFNRLASFPAFFNPLWLYIIWRVVRSTKPDLLLVRDLPLALSAIAVGRFLGIPVILDMAENYPAMMRDECARTPPGFQVIVNVFARNPAFVRAVERVAIRYVNHILVVVEESRERLSKMGVPDQNITVVTNSPTFSRLQPYTNEVSSISGTDGRALTLVYLGILELPRGLDTAIASIELLREQLPNLRLRIIGSGRDTEIFRTMVNEKELMNQVEFLGWIDYKDAIRHVQEADIGLVPHHVTESWNSTIPNKLFDYMSMGKPVIVSDAKPTKRIVEEERCGAVFKDRDPVDLSKAILKLLDEGMRRECGRRGQEAFLQRYNWDCDEKRLLAAMDTFVA